MKNSIKLRAFNDAGLEAYKEQIFNADYIDPTRKDKRMNKMVSTDILSLLEMPEYTMDISSITDGSIELSPKLSNWKELSDYCFGIYGENLHNNIHNKYVINWLTCALLPVICNHYDDNYIIGEVARYYFDPNSKDTSLSRGGRHQVRTPLMLTSIYGGKPEFVMTHTSVTDIADEPESFLYSPAVARTKASLDLLNSVMTNHFDTVGENGSTRDSRRDITIKIANAVGQFSKTHYLTDYTEIELAKSLKNDENVNQLIINTYPDLENINA